MDQKWQACLKYSKRDQNGLPEWFLTIWDPFGPIWTLFGHFRQKWICCPKWTKYGLAKVLRSKNQFLFEMVKKGPDGSKGVQNGHKHLGWRFWSFWTLLDDFGALTSLPCLSTFGSKSTNFFCHLSPVMSVGPQNKKRLITRSPGHVIGESWTFCREMDVVQKTPNTAFLSGQKSASPHFEGNWRQNCWHQENFWGTFENFRFMTEGQECTPKKFFLAGGQGN